MSDEWEHLSDEEFAKAYHEHGERMHRPGIMWEPRDAELMRYFKAKGWKLPTVADVEAWISARKKPAGQ